MDEIDAQIEAIRTELAALRAEPEPSIGRQLAFDIPVGVARAGAGLADVLSYPVVKGLEYAGAPVETFGLSKLLSAGAEQVAPTLGVQPETGTQELVSFLTPSPLSKAKLLSQAGTGLASYFGMKGAEAVAPESQYAGLVGALAGPAALSGASKAAGAIAPKLEEAGLGLQRRALGITKADYKNAKNAVIETVSGDFSTQLKESVDDLIKNKTLGTSLDPGAMFAELQGAKSATEDAIQTTLKAAETKIGPVPPPSFDKTLDYISKNIAADQVDKYVNNVIEFQDALRREGQGSLTYLNQQKKIIGENWKNSPQSDPGFWRTIYGDVKRHIEKYAPEVKDLNKEKQKLILAEPVVTRNFKASGADYDIGALQKLLNTTGGAGLAGGAILGAATGSLTGGVASALALRGLATPTGQNIVGRGLRGTASLAEALGKPPTRTTQTSQLISQKAFEEAQPYIHGTTEEGLQAITEAGNFIPKTIRYSVLGPGAIYGALKGSMWLDPERAAKARMWDLPKQIPIYLEPKAKIAQINNNNDWANLAKKVGMKPDELSKALWYDPTEYNAKQQLEVAEQVKKKLIEVGVDAIEMNTTPYNKTLKQIQDKYGEWWNKKLRKEDQQDWEYMATAPSEAIQRLRSRFSIYDAMGGEQQIAILNPKIAQPADKAYERLLKESPEQLRQITPDELAIISNSTKDKLLQSGYLSSKTVRDFEQLTKTTTEAPDDIDAAIEAARQELEALRSSTPQSETVKVGKQNISIPTGEEYAPPSLVKAVMKVESAGKQEAVSPKGATGLMQLMPATAKDLGVDATDAEQNVEGGSRYLQQMINKYGKTDIALAAYNWGPGNIDKAIRKLNAERKAVTWANIMQIVKVPMETRLYVNKVLKNREVEA
jgi:hypothetical protein